MSRYSNNAIMPMAEAMAKQDERRSKIAAIREMRNKRNWVKRAGAWVKTLVCGAGSCMTCCCFCCGCAGKIPAVKEVLSPEQLVDYAEDVQNGLAHMKNAAMCMHAITPFRCFGCCFCGACCSADPADTYQVVAACAAAK